MKTFFELLMAKGNEEKEAGGGEFLEWNETIKGQMLAIIEPHVPADYPDRQGYIEAVIDSARNMLQKNPQELHELQMNYLRAMADSTRDPKDQLNLRMHLVHSDAASAILAVVHKNRWL